MENYEEDWWDDLIAAERFAIYKVDGGVQMVLYHDFDDSTVELHTIDDVLYHLRKALERGLSVSINVEKQS
ncbi:hypothetical protein NJG17_08305 [Stenotrophomonas maltophilia]|jgi:hypothetical protein|uniref:hypothetical protein n=1 Tax=Stenotrophomonas maltophilia TaxID=40324 RepID=UPI000B4E10CB|nr:hypothetical protein [Stenotrophomonas maltophilia]MCO7499897.1 hypothetical protein [Stenotrophomonas maltophilia]OWQ59855.1 hypothetical protein CEE59_06195 [Stenotrophomonas maltophilia]HDS1140517.1 hypothetical protein [Stenotrophomonas maltophilia]HEL3835346.1 hypothetical protein [Stenotrophomonas maltophilia]HEL3839963.1 hypothetical protein [Stenotrophomonas maltophilia]